jgi:hypothetical protein
MTRPASKCEMVTVHHPDCTCQWCMAHLDERCAEPAVATVAGSGNLRVCEECAITMRRGDFAVAYDDGRTEPLS